MKRKIPSDKNREYVMRSGVKGWLLMYAPPSIVKELIEEVEDTGNAADIQMLRGVWFALAGDAPSKVKSQADAQL